MSRLARIARLEGRTRSTIAPLFFVPGSDVERQAHIARLIAGGEASESDCFLPWLTAEGNQAPVRYGTVEQYLAACAAGPAIHERRAA